MKAKRKNVGLFVVIAVFGVVLIGALFAYGAYVSANTPQPFVWERRHNAERLYRDTVEFDIDAYYPQTPAQLMDHYNNAFFFLHGDFILYDDVFKDVINFQRQLFSEELLSTTTAQQQFDNLMHNLETMREEGNIILRRPQVHGIRHDFYDQRTALAYVIHPFVLYEDLYRVYHLIMDESDRWRVNSWSRADSDFNIID